MQLFYKGDILQMRDKSQWEIISVKETYHSENTNKEYYYEYQNIETHQINLSWENDLNQKAIVIKLVDPIERPKCKIYYLDDYRKGIEKISKNG